MHRKGVIYHMVLQRHLTELCCRKHLQSIGLDSETDMKSSNLYLILIQWHEV